MEEINELNIEYKNEEEELEKDQQSVEKNLSVPNLNNSNIIINKTSKIPPKCTWKRNLLEADLTLNQFQVKISKGLKLMPLGIRMAKYVSRVRKEGKEPFMDPFIDETHTSNRGVPCGGIGAGSITRSWKGEFNHFFLHPGRPQHDAVKGNQFSIFIQREGIPSKAFVLGRPYKEDVHEEKEEEGFVDMPSLEPLPNDIASFLASLPDDTENNIENDVNNPNNEGEKAAGENNNSNNNNTSSNKLNSIKGKAKLASLFSRFVLRSKSKKINKKTKFITPSMALGDWNWKDINGEYNGLFPRAWTEYDMTPVDKKLKVTCKQISPVIPQNYKESSYPVCVFVWEVENLHPSKGVDISLMFTFQNGIGKGSDYTGGHYNKPFGPHTPSESSDENDDIKNNSIGVEMIYNNKRKVKRGKDVEQEIYHDPLSFGISTSPATFSSIQPEEEDRENSNNDNNQNINNENQLDSIITFETTGRGKEVWKAFSTTGRAQLGPQYSLKNQSEKGVAIGSAVSNYVHLDPLQSATITFALGWDQPIVRFGSGRGFYSRYTRFYGREGLAVPSICRDALANWRLWDKMIDDWQNPILNNPRLPNEYKCALFNELYYLVAGGTIWIDEEELEFDRERRRIREVTSSSSAPKLAKKSQEKESAKKVALDFLALSQNIDEGIMISDDPTQNAGKIIFSLDDLEVDKIYYTGNGNSLIRSRNQKVMLSSIVLRSPVEGEENNESENNGNIVIENNEEKSEEKNEQVDDETDEKAEEKSSLPKSEKIISNEYGQLLYLEGQEYLMYNTYDVHFYASFALIMLWPQLELNIQRDIARCTLIHAPNDLIYTLHAGDVKPRKLRGAIPHDLGTPSDDPFYLVNSYNIHDTNSWKDLNSKFALQVYRDYVATGDIQFLQDMWPVVWESMHYLERWDQNRDGMIENGGTPDQTYDAWSVEGTSAYCGSLWSASLAATCQMAKLLSLPEEVAYFQSLLTKSTEVFEKQLWTGVFYKYDDSGSRDDIIMSDQLVGEWYARASLLPSLYPSDHISSALKTVYNYNYKMFKKGELGVVNGFNYKTRQVDYSALQSCEVWVGTVYGLVANMLQEGLEDEGWEIFKSMYQCIYQKLGYWYQTPEAWDVQGRYRAYAYMRPLSIWSIQWTLEHRDLLADRSADPANLLPHLNPVNLAEHLTFDRNFFIKIKNKRNELVNNNLNDNGKEGFDVGGNINQESEEKIILQKEKQLPPLPPSKSLSAPQSFSALEPPSLSLSLTSIDSLSFNSSSNSSIESSSYEQSNSTIEPPSIEPPSLSDLSIIPLESFSNENDN